MTLGRCDLCHRTGAPETMTRIHLRSVCSQCAPGYRRLLRVVKYVLLLLIELTSAALVMTAARTSADDGRLLYFAAGVGLGAILPIHLLLERYRLERDGTSGEP